MIKKICALLQKKAEPTFALDKATTKKPVARKQPKPTIKKNQKD